MSQLLLMAETILLETCMEESRMTQLATVTVTVTVTVMGTGIEGIGDGEE